MNDIIFLWELIPMCFRVLNLFFTAQLIMGFMKPYLKRRITLAAAGAAYTLSMVIMLVVPCEVNRALTGLISGAAMFAVMLFYEREKPLQKIFISVIAYITPWTVHSAVVLIWGGPYELLLYNDIVMERPDLQFALFIVLEIFYYLARYIFMLLLFRTFNRFYIYKSEELGAREFVLMLLPILPAIGGYWLNIYYEDIYDSEHTNYLWTVRGEYFWVMLLYQAVLFAATLTTVYISQQIKKARREEKETAVLLGQTEDIRRHIAQLEKLYAETASLRHDVKNHICTLESLYKNGEGEQAAAYAAELSARMELRESGIKSGNPVTDIILEEKRAAAEERKVDFRCGFFFPVSSDINAFDISVILGNALDNAIENVSGGGYISVSSRRMKNSFLIEVQNSFCGDIVYGDCGLPETTKADKGIHGCGLANIRRVARKYNGELSFDVADDRAELTVLLMPEWDTQQKKVVS